MAFPLRKNGELRLEIINERVRNYIDELQPLCSGELGKIQQKAYQDKVPVIPKDVVHLISFILSVKRPKKVLEIGAAVGFSSALMSTFLAEGGSITTIERQEIMISKAQENHKKLNLKDRITLLEGDANDILPTLNDEYDVIFMDAAKGQYINILDECLRLLKVGGILIADDILHKGNVTLDIEEVPRRQRTTYNRMNEFLKRITNDPCLETSILTVDDGVALCHKIK